MTTWIAVADASHAKLFELTPERTLRMLQELEHPQARAKGDRLVTDRPGRMEERGESPKDIEADKFAHTLCELLQKGSTVPGFDHLILVGAPAFLGKIRKLLSEPVKKKILDTLNKDYAWLANRELAERLSEQLPL